MKLIPLTQGQFAKVDDEDFERLNQWKWHVTKQGYGARRIWYPGKSDKKSQGYLMLMHRDIMNPSHGLVVDHIDDDGLNNQRLNLRACSRAENLMNRGKNRNNTSGLKGVSFHHQIKKWIAWIGINRKRIYLGVFDTPEEAHKAYCKAAEQYHGEFAHYG